MTAFTHPRLREIAAYLDGVRGTLAGIITGTDRAKLVATIDRLLGGTEVETMLRVLDGTDIEYFPFPGFPEGILGPQLVENMKLQAERFGAKTSFGTVEAADFSKRPFVLTVDGERGESKTVIIATGASHRHLGLDSEHKLENKGVTYCATCDGAFYRKMEVAVIGGKRKEYQLKLNQEKMSALGITPDAVSNAIAQTGFLQSNGYMNDYRRMYLTITDA